MKNQDGFTLIEGLLALALLGIVFAGILPGFFTYMDANARNVDRTGAIAATQQVMEATRQVNPTSLPTSGSSAVEYITVNEREYEVVTRYCVLTALCNANTRHIVIEAQYAGRTLYTAESVFTKLR